MKIKILFFVAAISLLGACGSGGGDGGSTTTTPAVAPAPAGKNIIPYEVISRDEAGPIKLAFDIGIDLINGRLPNEEELGDISMSLYETEQRKRKHDRTFITFYLPGMKPGSGAFATAHHDPNMDVRILPYMLMQYPQYHRFLPEKFK